MADCGKSVAVGPERHTISLATRSETMDGSDGPKDLLDALLDMRSHEFTLTDIRGYLTDIFGAGSDTTAKTIEWAMAELICNPEKMKRAQAELDQVVGRNRRVEESDNDSLPYLHAVVKEVFRLHTVAPFLIPHRADSDCEIEGFLIAEQVDMTEKFGVTIRKAVPLEAISTPRLPPYVY